MSGGTGSKELKIERVVPSGDLRFSKAVITHKSSCV